MDPDRFVSDLAWALIQAVSEAKRYVTAAITTFLRWEKNGHRTDALNHFTDSFVCHSERSEAESKNL